MRYKSDELTGTILQHSLSRSGRWLREWPLVWGWRCGRGSHELQFRLRSMAQCYSIHSHDRVVA